MFDSTASTRSTVDAVLSKLDDALDVLVELDLGRLDRDELVQVVRRFEAHRRRQSVVDHRLVAELDARHVAAELGAADTKALLRDVLRISPLEASRGVVRRWIWVRVAV